MVDIELPLILYGNIGFFNIGFPDLPSLPDGMTGGGGALWVEAEHYKVVGACLAAARRRANVTQQELAARLGKPQSFVSEYERGQRRVDVVEFLLIAQAIGTDPLAIFTEIMRSTVE
jgi:hypothetical protein